MLTFEERDQLAHISGSRARETLAALVQGGERVAGSPAEQEEARRIRDLLQPFVDSCELEPFAVTTHLRGQGRLEVISPIHLEVRCEVNPVAPASAGEAILVDAGNGEWSDFRALGNVQGKVVLATPAGFGFSDAAMEAYHHGAMVLVCNIPRVQDHLISVHAVNAGIPVLTISNPDAACLRELLDQHQEVRVRFQAPQEARQSTSYNVVGVIQGTRFPDEVVYLSAHHDTWFQGANDNLSGVAGLVELARLFHRFRPARTVRLISFAAEESGIPFDTDVAQHDRGSFAYTLKHQAALSGQEQEAPVAVLNGETIGFTDQTEILATQELLPLVRGALADLGGRAVAKEPAQEPQTKWSGSDHLCFHTLGLPSAVLFPVDGPYWSTYHTPSENMEHTDRRALEANTRAWALMGMRLANHEGVLIDVDALAEVAGRGLNALAEGQKLRQALQEVLRRCHDSDSRETRLRQSLSLARLLHRNLYAFHGSRIVLRFQAAEEAVNKLVEAGNLLSRDRAGAREVLGSIPTAEAYRRLSPPALERIRQLQPGSAIFSRLAPFWLDLAQVWQALEGEDGVSEAEALSLLDDKAQAIREQARSWAGGLDAELRAFCQ